MSRHSGQRADVRLDLHITMSFFFLAPVNLLAASFKRASNMTAQESLFIFQQAFSIVNSYRSKDFSSTQFHIPLAHPLTPPYTRVASQ